MKYTEAKEELDKIITEIDRGDADIDTLSEKIKRAGELITLCRNKLRETEDNVENILSSFEN
jgi:exodeoxyribonuclease VII small subunit